MAIRVPRDVGSIQRVRDTHLQGGHPHKQKCTSLYPATGLFTCNFFKSWGDAPTVPLVSGVGVDR